MSPRRMLLVGLVVLALGLVVGAVIGRSTILRPVTAPVLVVLVGGAIAAAAYLAFRSHDEQSE